VLRDLYKQLITVFLVAFFFCASVSAASDDAKLKSLRKQITKVKTDISQKQKQQISVEQQLKNLKTKIENLTADYRNTLKKFDRQKSVLKKLKNDQAKQQSKLQDARQKFSAQMLAAYKIERPNYFKNLVNRGHQISPDVLLTYHGYVFIARLEQMHDIKKTLSHINRNKEQIQKQTKILASLESKQYHQRRELRQAQQERSKILGSLKTKIASQSQKLKQLINAKKNLEKLVIRLSPHKALAISSELMTRLCSNFVWPTKGVITTHFGSPVEQSSWSWSGVIISAPENQGVRAISSGKIVYADWFTGYGLLLIIDHGSGYMSLYGHNNDFRKGLNDKVEAGEIVSTVGRSGREDPGLYFAIRYNSKPVNPEKWCKQN
jgi:septal ring factor EnvC (AmiA/AmiB activator)